MEFFNAAGVGPYLPGEDGTTNGLTAPQSEARNFAVKFLSIAMFRGLPWAVPVTIVWLVPLKCSASVN
jgi:hypothetical protein